VDKVPEPTRSVPLMARGTAALDEIDDEMGLAFDDWDKAYYYDLFVYALCHKQVICAEK
jgi:phosphoribosylformylglycinamidine synthase